MQMQSLPRKYRQPFSRQTPAALTNSNGGASSDGANDGDGDASPNICGASDGDANPNDAGASPSAGRGPSRDDGRGPSALLRA